MTTGPRIIVGYDTSADATAAVDWATGYATVTGGSLLLLSAWNWPTYAGAPLYPDYEPERLAEDRLEALSARVGLPADRVQVKAAKGSPAKLLVEAAADADLVVVGSRGLDPFTKAVLGSVSSALAQHAPCPAAIVRPSRRDVSQGVVVGVDDSASARGALLWAMDYADALGEPLTVVHCIHPPPYGPQYGYSISYDRHAMTHGAATWLAELVDKAIADRGRPVTPPIEKLVIEGAAAQVLHDQFHDARALVVGRRGAGGFRRLILGSVSSALAHHAEGTVVITPTVH